MTLPCPSRSGREQRSVKASVGGKKPWWFGGRGWAQGRVRPRPIFLLSIVILFFGFSLAAITQLLVIHNELDQRDGENTLWALAQAQNHGSKLQRDDELFRAGQISRDALSLQEDILFSRLTLLQDGPQMRLLIHFGQDQPVIAAIAAFEQADTGSLAALPRRSAAHQALAQMINVLAVAGNEVMVLEREARSRQLEQLGGLIQAAFVAILVVVLTGGLLIWQLMRSLARQRGHVRTIAEQRDALQHTVHDLELARTATETYRNFVSLVSHQFRTPLAVIDSTAQRLMRSVRNDGEADAEQLVEKMGLTRTTVGSLTKLLDSVLNSVRIDSGGLHLQSQPMNLAELVGRVLAANAPLLVDRPLLMETAGALDVYACMGDAGLLEHTLQNLLSNACKYTEPGTAIAVDLVRDEASGQLSCTVRDWGAGVSVRELPMLFDRFYRATRVQPTEGSGLGLYLARYIARLHGGELDAYLPEDGGLAVRLRIPVA